MDAAPEPSLDTLLRDWREGRDGAVEELLRLVSPRVHHLASRRLGHALRRRVDSQDVVQETLLAFFRRSPHFVVESEAQLIALLAKILERNVIRQHRHEHRGQRDLAREACAPTHSTITFGAQPAPWNGPATEAEREDEIARTRLALEMLDPIDHRIVTMRTYQNATFDAIAAEVELSAEAVRKRFDRALPKLRAKLDALRAGRLDVFLADG
jgi:RNA polymerase sigma factor (sigma-70 family)